MAWTLFVVSLTFIVGIQAYPPLCNGTEPWQIEDNDIVGVDFINTIIRLHMRRVTRSQSRMSLKLFNFAETVEHTFTESIINTDSEKVRGIENAVVRRCHEYATKDRKEKLEEVISSLYSRYIDLSDVKPKMERIFSNYQHPTEDVSAERQIDIEEAKKAYAAICKLSGTLVEDFDQLTFDIEYVEKSLLQPVVERCTPLMKNM